MNWKRKRLAQLRRCSSRESLASRLFLAFYPSPGVDPRVCEKVAMLASRREVSNGESICFSKIPLAGNTAWCRLRRQCCRERARLPLEQATRGLRKAVCSNEKELAERTWNYGEFVFSRGIKYPKDGAVSWHIFDFHHWIGLGNQLRCQCSCDSLDCCDCEHSDEHRLLLVFG